VLALATLFACKLNPDTSQVIALEVILPDSGRVEVNDSFFPHARALNGAGDSVPTAVFWRSLDTAIIKVPDSTMGVALAIKVGTGRLQAQVEALRSNPQDVMVLARLDTLFADGPDSVTVVAPDSLSDALQVKALATGGEAINRRVVYALATYPDSVSTVTFVPNDTVFTSSIGVASVQIRFVAGTLPDSVVVFATMRRLDDTQIPGSPVKFVVEFRP
jgi:hypothetical protein